MRGRKGIGNIVIECYKVRLEGQGKGREGNLVCEGIWGGGIMDKEEREKRIFNPSYLRGGESERIHFCYFILGETCQVCC